MRAPFALPRPLFECFALEAFAGEDGRERESSCGGGAKRSEISCVKWARFVRTFMDMELRGQGVHVEEQFS